MRGCASTAPNGRPIGTSQGRPAADPVIAEVTARRQATPTQIALAWLLHRYEPVLPIPSTSSIQHLEENIAAGDIELDKQDMQRLEGATRVGGTVVPAHH
jgi:pyridoxine 4-dehydrogenase